MKLEDVDIMDIDDNDLFSENDWVIEESKINQKKIAIIGMSLRLPGADTKEEYFKKSLDGKCFASELSENRKRDIIDYKKVTGQSKEVSFQKGSFFKDISLFDTTFFNIPPKDAQLMHPSQRFFLRASQEALEDAGYGGDALKGTNTGVFLGMISDLDAYKYRELIYNTVDLELYPLAVPGNIGSITASRVSYLFDFKGPCIITDTACSSSLVSVHYACTSLLNGECDQALVGGVRLYTFPCDDGFKFGMESNDGITKAFDNCADGTGIGEGCAAILIKPLNKAISDGDNIYAVINGSTINHDGYSNGITAPNPNAQTSLLVKAWENAGIKPDSIGIFETHGTGTKLGDPIEIQALTEAFERFTDKKQFCALGASKTHYGHMYEVSGLFSLIKGALTLKYRKMAPNASFLRPNQQICFEKSPLYFNNKVTDFSKEEYPLRCGVNSFGFTGTNCHVILEEIKEIEKDKDDGDYFFIPFSAMSEKALSTVLESTFTRIREGNNLRLKDIGFTLTCGRGVYTSRMLIRAKNTEDLCGILSNLISDGIKSNIQEGIFYSGDLDENNIDVIEDEKILKYIKNCENTEFCRRYKNIGARRISLPSYPFEEKRYWPIEKSLELEEYKNANEVRTYSLQWEIDESFTKKILNRDGDYQVAFISIGSEASLNYCKRLSTYFKNVFFFGAEEIMEHTKISNTITEFLHKKNSRIIISIIGDEKEDEILDYKKYVKSRLENIFKIFKSLFSYRHINSLKIFLIANNTERVLDHDKIIYPLNSSIIGFGKVADNEYPGISVATIDTDIETNEQLIAGIIKEESTKITHYSLRNNKRYIQKLTESSVVNSRVEFSSNGYYVITGGLGGIGLAIMEKMAQEKIGVKFLILTRKGISVIDGRNSDDEVKRNRAKKVREVRELGAKIRIVNVDICDEEEIKCAIKESNRIFGRLLGVFHLAGVSGDGLIRNKELEQFTQVISPKIAGTMSLFKVIRNEKPDFLLLFSSVITLAAIPGQSDYSSANSYLNSFASFVDDHEISVSSILWGPWRDVGMWKEQSISNEEFFKAITNEKAFKFLSYVLSNKPKGFIAADLDFNSTNYTWLLKAPFKLSDEIEKSLKMKSEKTRRNVEQELNTSIKLIGDNNYSPYEICIANAIYQILGFDEIDVDSDLFSLGIESIHLSRLYNRISSLYPGKLMISDVYKERSIRNIAKRIRDNDNFMKDDSKSENKKKNESKTSSIENLLDDLESGQIDVEEAMKHMCD